MLSVVPLVVAVADEALARNRARLRTAVMKRDSAPFSDDTTSRSGPRRPHDNHRVKTTGGNKRQHAMAQNYHSDDSNKEGDGEQKELLLCLLHQAKFLVSADKTGCMKQDMAALRLLLSPPS